MTANNKHRPRALFVFAATLVLMAFGSIACSNGGSDGPTGDNKVEEDPTKTVHPDKEGAAVLVVTGTEGTPWRAEIISGGGWTSFDRARPASQGGQAVKTGEVGTTLAAKNQYVYYWANTTEDTREAVIRFTFEGELPVEIVLTQYSVSTDDNVYTLHQDQFWPEIPAQVVSDNYIYVSHFATMTNQKTQKTYNARNYTLCFDKTKAGSWWVAYPLHTSYTGTGRIETWAYDPKISSEYQPDLSRGYTNGTVNNRGHQIPNADRSGVPAMQAQTFYFSNMTPQNGTLNQNPWAKLEETARQWMCSDTLYVVTGAWWGNNPATTTDRNGKVCPLPDYYFKVFVRTVSGKIRQDGDKLGDYTASQLQSIAFWAPNNASVSQKIVPDAWVTTVADIEEKTGFVFFPTLPPSVKTQKDKSRWSGL